MKIKTLIKKYWAVVKLFFQLKWDALRLDLAIFMADALQRAKNKQFYVLDDGHGKLIWLCKDDIKVMKKPRIVQRLVKDPVTGLHKLRKFKVSLLPKHISHTEVMRDCLYYTPVSRNNSNGITVEERNKRKAGWLTYMEQVRMDRMFGKLKVKK